MICNQYSKIQSFYSWNLNDFMEVVYDQSKPKELISSKLDIYRKIEKFNKRRARGF